MYDDDWQVRDVLKGALKPTCLSDTESELAGYGYVYGWTSAALVAAGVKRQLSEGSAHRFTLSSPFSLVTVALVVVCVCVCASISGA